MTNETTNATTTEKKATRAAKKEVKRYAAKDLAAMLHMSAKNLRKHLRNLEIAKNEELGRYSFTEKQAETICAKIEEHISKEDAATEELA